MALNSETVLDNWCPESLYNYSRENDIDLTLPQAYAVIQAHRDPPYGWLVARDMFVENSTDNVAEEKSEIGPYLYWHQTDAEEDANIYREDGYADVFITQAVDHETMCSFLTDFLNENAEAMVV